MKRELRDELEVPGHVVMIHNMTKGEAISRVRNIMDRWEAQGYSTVNQAPTGPEKEEYLRLLAALGIEVKS